MVESDISISEKQKALVAEFEFMGDWTEKYEHIISLGKSMLPLDEKYKKEDNLIKGCQSKVWLHAYYENGRVYYNADSDAIITKGLISLIINIFSGHNSREIIGTDTTFIDEMGLHEHLSPTRSNGLLSMIKQIKFYALAFMAKE